MATYVFRFVLKLPHYSPVVKFAEKIGGFR